MNLQSSTQQNKISFGMPNQISNEMQDCISNCTTCALVCEQMISHCLGIGGPHAEQSHIKLLVDCARICATSAQFMARESDYHMEICRACAAICTACAEDCAKFGDDSMMKECAEVCRRCAESCSRMAAKQ